jgi:hypothetical protein
MVEHGLAHIGQWQGRRARYRSKRKNWTPEQARTVIDIAVRWCHETPRKAALEQLVT